jgi:aryl carrier-like protein
MTENRQAQSQTEPITEPQTEKQSETQAVTQALTLEQMRADIARIIEADLDEVGDDENLMDLGLDSMRMLGLVVKWGQSGIKLEFSDLAEYLTLGEWWVVIQRLQKQAGQS